MEYILWKKSNGATMNAYVSWVMAYPILSAMIQFAILGTLGEIISKWLVQRKFKYPFSVPITLWKMLVWTILAIGIKYAFKGYTGMVEYFESHHYLPQLGTFSRALAISVLMNTQFGLTLVIMHRVLDNIPEKHKNWANLHKSMYSLLWFWIPAHTVTFMLPDVYRIGLAALWSVALGIILGFNNRR
ncbi:MAG TPA: hypothetical protein PL188_04570 [Candidatus Cloacimonadota bacterium]|nr:hypothetical protein [Candidatus Cloacimonadota bacterium]